MLSWPESNLTAVFSYECPAFVSPGARLHEPQRLVWFGGRAGVLCERASLPLRVTDPRSGVILALALLLVLVLVVVPVGLVGVIRSSSD
jgi:hypothetical protein